MKILGKQIVVADHIDPMSKADDLLPDSLLETFGNIGGASAFCFDAFSSREPVSTSLENALAGLLPVRSRGESADNQGSDISPSFKPVRS